MTKKEHKILMFNCVNAIIFQMCIYLSVPHRINLDTMWRYIHVTCSAYNTLHQFKYNWNIACRHLSYRHRCVWFPYKWHRRFGRWGFWLCHGLWRLYILNKKKLKHTTYWINHRHHITFSGYKIWLRVSNWKLIE